MTTTFQPEEFTPASTPEISKQAGEMNTHNGSEKSLARDRTTQPDRAKPAAGGMMRLFKGRNFPLLFGGQTISTFGDALYMVALPALVQGPMHGSASGFGFILAGWGAGALIGSILAGMLGKYRHKGLLILLGGLIIAAMFALLPVGSVPGAVICMVIGGIASSGFAVLFFTAIQMTIPGHLMGRVMGLVMFSAQGLYPLSTALAGVLANHFGPASLFPLAGLVLAVTILFGMTQKVLRAL